MAARPVPTSRAVPARTASGRSVLSRMTSTGLPSAGPSSCRPPLSVSSRWALAISQTKGA
jgi:hypothetical protein